jgi:hypothetical protein
MDTNTLSSSGEGLVWWKRTCVAWELEGEDGLRKSRLPSGRWPSEEGAKKSTRAPTRGVDEGVCSPHMFADGRFWWFV